MSLLNFVAVGYGLAAIFGIFLTRVSGNPHKSPITVTQLKRAKTNPANS